ncbi:uncharacterized protein RCC_12075 [Ramularia collo-cygni]|uniref:Dehydrogenases with different specificities (Related to short-chain alcohol dehydrogenases) n=1 Tax=Ramularia collo-cygni TaxID=112498 RepID=A0A2D3UM09_9PEZI|nr:uncharacterized protein RCC_12075 [Ramularia collo-cygni]CZT14611.1 uncharacterized protein RCC_12075 [Ramularia collo-cygni]
MEAANNGCSGVALITNAGTDLGASVAKHLIQAGCTRIVLAHGSIAPIKEIRDKLPSKITVELMEYDPTSLESIEKVIKSTVSKFGHLKHCINILTLLQAPSKPTAEASVEDFKSGMTSSARQIWLACKAEITQLVSQHEASTGQPQSSAIVNVVPYGNIGIHSGHGLQAVNSYSCVGITKSLAWDHRKQGIRVNVVAPAATDSKEDRGVASVETLKQVNPLERLIEVDEVASTVCFLVGDGGKGINGVVLPVDSGWNLVHG